MKNCRTLQDFKNHFTKGDIDKQDFLAEASKILDDEDLGLLEIYVGE